MSGEIVLWATLARGGRSLRISESAHVRRTSDGWAASLADDAITRVAQSGDAAAGALVQAWIAEVDVVGPHRHPWTLVDSGWTVCP